MQPLCSHKSCERKGLGTDKQTEKCLCYFRLSPLSVSCMVANIPYTLNKEDEYGVRLRGPLKVPISSSSFKVGKRKFFNTFHNNFQQLVLYLEYTMWKTSSKSTAPTTLRRLQLPFTKKDDVSPHTHLNFF